jgi:eukaryotic-like serine/threonine-protein kinase
MRTPDGHMYLIDFGIARHFKPGQTHDTVLGLSLGYAAPEQFGRAQTSPQSDIYSLGATLYHLLTGIHPILNQPSFFDFPPLRLPSQPTPLALERLIAQMVSKDMSKRPASMTVVKQELQRITDQGRTGQLSPGTLLCTYRGHSYGFAF